MDDKDSLRAQMNVRRKGLSFSEKTRKSKQISERVVALPQWRQARTICIYRAINGEVDTKLLLTQKKEFLILEPKPVLSFPDVNAIDLFVVPGLAFDFLGYRLGWGKGYYDRLLASAICPKIGLSYSFQLVPRLPHKKYDIPMNVIVTENETHTP